MVSRSHRKVCWTTQTKSGLVVSAHKYATSNVTNTSIRCRWYTICYRTMVIDETFPSLWTELSEGEEKAPTKITNKRNFHSLGRNFIWNCETLGHRGKGRGGVCLLFLFQQKSKLISALLDDDGTFNLRYDDEYILLFRASGRFVRLSSAPMWLGLFQHAYVRIVLWCPELAQNMSSASKHSA